MARLSTCTCACYLYSQINSRFPVMRCMSGTPTQLASTLSSIAWIQTIYVV